MPSTQTELTEREPVKRYVLDIKNGVQEYVPHDYYPATTSLPMVLASAYDSLAAKLKATEMDSKRLMYVAHNYREIMFWGMTDDEIREAIDSHSALSRGDV